MRPRTLDPPLLLKPSDHDRVQGIFVPALGHAVRYDRGVGYFSLGWLRKAWCALRSATTNGRTVL
jgi:hypothetical protein